MDPHHHIPTPNMRVTEKATDNQLFVSFDLLHSGTKGESHASAAEPVARPSDISHVMRKQYHLRHSERGLFAWDVERLIMLTADAPVINVPLDAIREIDEPYWFQDESSPTCRTILNHLQLTLDADLRHPIILCAEGRVMDGMHRVLKAALSGAPAIAARRFHTTPEPDYIGVPAADLPY